MYSAGIKKALPGEAGQGVKEFVTSSAFGHGDIFAVELAEIDSSRPQKTVVMQLLKYVGCPPGDAADSENRREE